MFTTYILYSFGHDRYYVGHCEDMVKRLKRHNDKQVISTKRFAPWQLVYIENFNSRSEAFARERKIKSMKSRIYIESLLSSRRNL